MVVDIDFDNLNKYSIRYIPLNKNLDLYDDIELYFYKSLIKTKGNNYNTIILNPTIKTSVTIRILLYGLFDWYDKFGENKVNYTNFLNWFKLDKTYKRYLALIYLHSNLLTDKLRDYESQVNMSNEDYEKLNNDDLKNSSINMFVDDYRFSKIDFINSKYSPKKFKLKTINVDRSVILMNGLFFNMIDANSKTGLTIKEEIEILPKTRYRKELILNRNFFKLKERFEQDKWIL